MRNPYVTTNPHPYELRNNLSEKYGATIAQAAVKRRSTGDSPPRPTVETATWLAHTAATTDRIRGARARLYVCLLLRYRLRVDQTPPKPVKGLGTADIEWCGNVARDLAADAPVKLRAAA